MDRLNHNSELSLFLWAALLLGSLLAVGR